MSLTTPATTTPAATPAATGSASTAPASTGPGTTTSTVDLPDTWAYGAGVLHGGWLLERITAAALEQTAHPHPLAVSAHYASGPRIGSAELDVESLREGRGVATLRGRLRQGDRPKVEVLVTAGTLPESGVAPRHSSLQPPAMPDPQDCVVHTMPPSMPRNGITEQLEVRLDPATAGWTTGTFGGSAEVRGWIRSRDGREPDPLLLLTVADALPPVTFDLGISGWVPTLELTVLLRAVPAPGWLRCVQRAHLIHGGLLDEECEIWDSTGRLVAQARQLAAFRETA